MKGQGEANFVMVNFGGVYNGGASCSIHHTQKYEAHDFKCQVQLPDVLDRHSAGSVVLVGAAAQEDD